MMRVRGKLFAIGKTGKYVLGAIMLWLGIAILTGCDKVFEAWLITISPDW